MSVSQCHYSFSCVVRVPCRNCVLTVTAIFNTTSLQAGFSGRTNVVTPTTDPLKEVVEFLCKKGLLSSHDVSLEVVVQVVKEELDLNDNGRNAVWNDNAKEKCWTSLLR